MLGDESELASFITYYVVEKWDSNKINGKRGGSLRGSKGRPRAIR
jgi:hypothetical protein